MNVLVTGGCGFIGHHLVRKLVDLGHQVVVWDNLSTGKKERLPDGVELNVIDILYDELPNGVYDAVFHLASPTSVPESILRPIKYENGCLDMTRIVFKWSVSNNVKYFTFSSTSAIYGESQDIPLSEETSESPMSPYAKYKSLSEKYLNVFSENLDCQISVMRFFNVFGEEQPSEGSYAPAIAKFISQLNSGNPITVTGDGLQTRDYVYVADVVNALILTLENKKYRYNIFNVGSGIENRILDIAKQINGDIVFIEERKEPKRSCADITKIKEILGWEPTTTIFKWIESKGY
jgi:UDP-glucose 4-epimerase